MASSDASDAVTTLAKVAQDPGETIELLDDLTDQMGTEDRPDLGLRYRRGSSPRTVGRRYRMPPGPHRRTSPPRGVTDSAALDGGVRLAIIYYHFRLTDDHIKQASQDRKRAEDIAFHFGCRDDRF